MSVDDMPGMLEPSDLSGGWADATEKYAHPGCCTVCDGTGIDVTSPETGGQCWDCLGTGHPHETEGLNGGQA